MMQSVVAEISKYLVMILCVIYAFSSLTMLITTSEERQLRKMNRQERYIFLFHFICFVVLFCSRMDVRILGMYLAQAIYLKGMIGIYGRLYPDSSRVLINHMCFLLSIGFVVLTRLSFDTAVRQFAIAAGASLLSLLLPFIVSKAHWLKKLRWFYGLIGFLCLSSLFVLGKTVNGSTNWIKIGQLSFQPSEFIKIAFVFFIAAMLERNPGRRGVMVTAVFSALHVIVLILQKDLGGALLYFVIYVFMCYAATGRLTYLVGGFTAGALAARLAYSLFSHVRVRFQAWKDPWSDIENSGYQITQSLFAIGTGGWFGLGLAQGRPYDIPVVESDFIFAAIAEEFGLIFAIALLLVYLCIFVQFLKIALDARQRFYKLIAFGFSVCFLMQVFLCVGGVTKFIPSTGVTLPLISYGGSSVASTLMIFAVIQGIFIINYKEDEENEEKVEGSGDGNPGPGEPVAAGDGAKIEKKTGEK